MPLSLLAVLLLFQSPAAADLSGTIELDYSRSRTTNRDSSGSSSATDSNVFLQRYRLGLSRALYPYLTFTADGLFEKNITDTVVNGVSSKPTETRIFPLISLNLSTPLYSGSAGYSRLEDKITGVDIFSASTIRETYNAALGWRPAGLPAINGTFIQTHTYDKAHVAQDTMDDLFAATVTYSPFKNLALNYSGSYDKNHNRLSGLDFTSIAQTAKASFNQQFFDRVSLNADYTYNDSEIKASSTGSGVVPFKLFPFSGLSVLSDFPTFGALDQNPALIDGNLQASSGVSIGPVAAGGDTRRRNIGVDFLNATEVNSLLLWVDRTLPPVVSNSFSWDIYISSDNMNWTLFSTVAPASFGPFDNRFEIDFPNVTTRYLKVVTKPLPPTVLIPPGFDVSNILITELQAFVNRTGQQISGKTTAVNNVFDVGIRTRILDNPALVYSLYYFQTVTTATGQPSLLRYVLSNSLTASHRFSAVISGSAMLSREDTKDEVGKGTTYKYSAALNARPLPTVSNGLVISGQSETRAGRSSSANSLFLNNSAELYRGVSLLISGGVNRQTNEGGQKSDTMLVNFGLGVTPRQNLNLSISYQEQKTKQSGGDLPDKSLTSRSESLAVSYKPFETVYIFASVGITAEPDQPSQTTQNYAVTWSPFRTGALQFNFAYNQSLTSPGNQVTTTLTPTIRWYITPRAYIDIAYTEIKNASLVAESDEKAFSASFRTRF